MAKNTRKTFGATLRERRIDKGYSLRKFALLVNVSPTYLSQVEQCNVASPTADRVKHMAELLEANPDEWIALAGRVPDDLAPIIQKQPLELPDLLRAVNGLNAGQLRQLRENAERMKKEG